MTILGKHTIEETREQIRLIEFRVKAEDDMLALKSPLPNDDKTVAAVARYAAWRTKWRAVATKALDEMRLLSIAQPLVPISVIACESQYKAVRCAISKSCDDSFTDPGDMQNVINALNAALNAKPDLSGFRKEFPEHPAGFDPDFEAFKKLDATIREGEKAAAAAKTGAGKVKDSVFDAIPWYAWVGGGVAAVAVVGFYAAPLMGAAALLPRRP